MTQELPTLQDAFADLHRDLSGSGGFTAENIVSHLMEAVPYPPRDILSLVAAIRIISEDGGDPVAAAGMYGLMLGVRIERQIKQTADAAVSP